MKKRRVPRKLVIGLTGGLGTGKSTVLSMFRKRGALTLDADAIVHEILERDTTAKSAIRKGFGAIVFSGKRINRPALAKVVFGSSGQRRKLEKIIHPRVRQRMKRKVSRAKKGVVVCDVPLLFERGWGPYFDSIIVVKAPNNIQRKRLRARGFVDADIEARTRAQWSLRKKVKKADFVVDNRSTRKKTENQVQKIWSKFKQKLTGGSHGISRTKNTI